MLADSDRLQNTIEQVLRAGTAGRSHRHLNLSRVDLSEVVRDCLELAGRRRHLPDDALHYSESLPPGERATVLGDSDELKAAVSNLLDNAIKYSGNPISVRSSWQSSTTSRWRFASPIRVSGSRPRS